MNLPALLQLLSTLAQTRDQDDWGTMVQYACETIWSALDETRATAEQIQAFIKVVAGSPAILALSQLVIPELRPDTRMPSLNDQKNAIVEELRKCHTGIQQTDQTHFDSPLYRAEKEMFQDMRMHSARLFLQHSGQMGPEDESRLMEWLEQQPKL